jgi:hypothetical protein
MKHFLLVLFLSLYMVSDAQVSLTTSPYKENFNNLATAVPTGFSLKKQATASSAGIDTVINSEGAASLWATTTRGFKNCASASGLTSTATGSEQDGSTNRALAVRQSGNFGDPGAAFVFQIANTTNKYQLKLDFLLQSLDAASPRTTTWVVDYGFGNNPSAFTQVTTITPASLQTGNTTFSNTSVRVNFGNALDNKSEKVWIRVWAPQPSSGLGNRTTTAIDDWEIAWDISSSIRPIHDRLNDLVITGNLSSVTSIQMNKVLHEHYILRVYNNSGLLIWSQEIKRPKTGQTIMLQPMNVPSGLYWLSLYTKEGVQSYPIIK